jgi:hypothetical protein
VQADPPPEPPHNSSRPLPAAGLILRHQLSPLRALMMPSKGPAASKCALAVLRAHISPFCSTCGYWGGVERRRDVCFLLGSNGEGFPGSFGPSSMRRAAMRMKHRDLSHGWGMASDVSDFCAQIHRGGCDATPPSSLPFLLDSLVLYRLSCSMYQFLIIMFCKTLFCAAAWTAQQHGPRSPLLTSCCRPSSGPRWMLRGTEK